MPASMTTSYPVLQRPYYTYCHRKRWGPACPPRRLRFYRIGFSSEHPLFEPAEEHPTLPGTWRHFWRNGFDYSRH